MDEEIGEIIKSMQNSNSNFFYGFNFIEGILCGQKCVVVLCGVGKVHAAMCTQTMIIKYNPKFIINIGVAGGIGENINIGDIVIADSVLQHDFDVSPFRPKGEISGLDITNIPCSSYLNNKIYNSIKELSDYSVHIGPIMTGDQFINSSDTLEMLNCQFHGIACEMEGGSIGQVCYVNKIEFAVIRIISDKANDTSHVDFSQFVKYSSKLCFKLIIELLKQI